MEPKHYLIVLKPPRATFAEDATEAESGVVGEHFEYLKKLHADGTLILAGRTEDASMGLVVLKADSEEAADSLMQADPAVKAGVFTARLYPYRLALLGKG